MMYLLSVFIIGSIIANWTNSDLGLWSQVIEWPLAAMLALLAVDLIVMRYLTAR